MQIVAKIRGPWMNSSQYATSPAASQMKPVEILGRSLDGIVHFFRMGPVAHARRALPDSLAADNI